MTGVILFILLYVVTVIYLISEVVYEKRRTSIYQELCKDLYEFIYKRNAEYLERIIQQGETND